MWGRWGGQDLEGCRPGISSHLCCLTNGQDSATQSGTACQLMVRRSEVRQGRRLGSLLRALHAGWRGAGLPGKALARPTSSPWQLLPERTKDPPPCWLSVKFTLCLEATHSPCPTASPTSNGDSRLPLSLPCQAQPRHLP